MWIESTIAMRFLREGRIQTLLILVGIAVGVAVIVFITALIQGLQANIVERTLGTQAHIKVQAPDEINRLAPLPDGTTRLVLETRRAQRLRSINNWQQVQQTLDGVAGITAVSPVASGPAFARRGNAVESVALVGIDPVRYQRIIPIAADIISGSLRVGAGDAVIGSLLADDLGVRVGDKFRVQAGDDREAQLNIAGIFELGVRDLDERYPQATWTPRPPMAFSSCSAASTARPVASCWWSLTTRVCRSAAIAPSLWWTARSSATHCMRPPRVEGIGQGEPAQDRAASATRACWLFGWRTVRIRTSQLTGKRTSRPGKKGAAAAGGGGGGCAAMQSTVSSPAQNPIRAPSVKKRLMSSWNPRVG